jgi:hypothetical protein
MAAFDDGFQGAPHCRTRCGGSGPFLLGDEEEETLR